MFALSAAGMRTFSPCFAPTYWTRLACLRSRVAHSAWFLLPELRRAPYLVCLQSRIMHRAWFAAGAVPCAALCLCSEPYLHRAWLAFGTALRTALGLPPEPHCAPRSSATFLILEYLISKERYSSFTFIKSTPKMHFRNQTKKADDAREERQPPEGGTPTALGRDADRARGRPTAPGTGQPC